MKTQLNQVKDFHRQIGVEVAAEPKLLGSDPQSASELALELRGLIRKAQVRKDSSSSLIARSVMAIEELAEWLEAHSDRDLNAAADAWADRCYLLLGDAIAAGLPVESLFEAVHQSNMTKSAPGTSTGKAVKSDRFQKPEFQLEIKEKHEEKERERPPNQDQ